MPGLVIILGLVITGALVGFLFSRKGHEKEGAVQGAKFTCGCIFGIIMLIIAVVVVIILLASGAF